MKRLSSFPTESASDRVGSPDPRTRSLRQFLGSPILLSVALFSFLILALILSNWVTCGWFLLGVTICAIPGWFACKLLYGAEYVRRLDSLGHTLILGLLVTTFLSVIIAALGPGLTVPTMLAAALGGTVLFFLLGRRMTRPLSPVQDDDPAATRLTITVGLILVLAVIAGPFLNVGRKIEDSYAYAPYFNRDFFRNLAFGAALSKGAVPPANPYFEGETLHYYWFQMVFPALVYRLAGRSATLQDIFLLSTLLINISFVFIFAHLLRRFVKRVPALIIVLGLAFVAESYQAPFKAVLSSQPTHWAMEGTWLGTITLPPVGYLFQSLLYLPHHFAALVALLVVISLLVDQDTRGRSARTLAAAIMLILSSGFSFFTVAFGFFWAGSYLALQAIKDVCILVKDRQSEQYRSSVVVTVLSGIIVGVAGLVGYGILSGLKMLLEDGNAWSIYVSRFQLVVPIRFFVMLGPMSVLGLAGFMLCVHDPEMRSRSYGLLWLLLSTFFFIVFVVPKNLPTWEVSQKLGIVLRIPALVLSGMFLDYCVNRGIRQHKAAWVVLLFFCASAVPNLLAYEYVHLNIRDSNLLTYVGAPERKAAEWIRTHTPLDAVVQSWPGGQTSVKLYYRPEEDTYSLIPVFGERQTAVGDPQFASYYLSRPKYWELDARSTELSQVYQDPGQSDVVGILEKFQIGYLYWGISERECCLRNLTWYEKSPLFEKVYDQDGVSIFRFNLVGD